MAGSTLFMAKKKIINEFYNRFQVTKSVNFCFVPNTPAASNRLTGQKDFLPSLRKRQGSLLT